MPQLATLLLLRGARSPYVLVDEPHETIRLVEIYRRWLDQGPATLRELGTKALSDPRAPFQPLPEATLLEFA